MTPEERVWHREQCAKFKEDLPKYKIYAPALEKMLKAICRIHAPLAIVQARPKGFASFAEKMARKAARYVPLGIGPTDLCGARVITETQSEVERVCAAIAGCAGFVIDKENSVDVGSRLKPTEFGYRSIHYVVQLDGKEVFGETVPAEVKGLKAEIQVRTLVEHAWASIYHDRIYKSSFKVPKPLERDLARVAAFLEEADQQFGLSVCSLDAYKLHYGVYMDKKRLEEEAEILRTVLDSEPEAEKKPAAALRLAQLARSTGDWKAVRELLASYVETKGDWQTEVLAEHGHALCQLHREQPRSDAFGGGQKKIERALASARGDLRKRVLAYRAWATALVPGKERDARDRYREAYEADPDNPFHLATYVGYELYSGQPMGSRAVTKPAFEKAIAACRAHADAGIELPRAFLTMGRFNLLLKRPYESLAAYARAIRLCLSGDCVVPVDTVDAELAFLDQIHRAKALPESDLWVRDLLLLAKSIRRETPDAQLAAKRSKFRSPVVILAGGTDISAGETARAEQAMLLQAFAGFGGTLISGGTTAGVAGIAGAIAKQLKGGTAEVLGYVPKSLPVKQPADKRYSALIETASSAFSPREPLQYWTDLLAAGIKPADVRVIGIGGGRISAFEYRVALAFGAKLALIEPASRAAAELLRDPDWQGDPHLLRMPLDRMTIHAYVNPPHPALTKKQVQVAAQRIHRQFLAENRWKNPDPAMVPWDKLRDDLKDSNRMQAEHAAGFLEACGFRVRRKKGHIRLPKFTKEEIERMAEMEHGRWVVERLQSGWRFDQKRDPDKKRSPSLVAWDKLTDQVKTWDRNAVAGWPKILREAGLEVVRR